jgi:hypothetical protein
MARSYRFFDVPEVPRAYRAMTLTGDGRVAANVPLCAGSDLEALTAAEVLAGELAVELWDGLRFIGRFEPRTQRLELAV